MIHKQLNQLKEEYKAYQPLSIITPLLQSIENAIEHFEKEIARIRKPLTNAQKLGVSRISTFKQNGQTSVQKPSVPEVQIKFQLGPTKMNGSTEQSQVMSGALVFNKTVGKRPFENDTEQQTKRAKMLFE